MITPSTNGYTYSNFVLGIYDIQKTDYQSEQSFEKALNSKINSGKLAWGCSKYGDKGCYVGIDYLPEETQNLFLKALNEGYKDNESAKFRPFGLDFFNQIISDTYVTHHEPLEGYRRPENLEKYGFSFKERFEMWKDFYNKSSLSEEELENFNLSCQIYENFLTYLGPLANKSILRENDKSTLYPPDSTLSFKFEQKYQLSFQLTQQIVQKDDLLFELLNPKD